MLVAILNGERIFSLAPEWEGRKEELRGLCNNVALCVVCGEPVVCKFGEERIHHFAHGRGSNCPGEQDTYEHMMGKAALYGFVQPKLLDRARVEIEYRFVEADITADIVATFPGGKQWAIEFYSRHITKKEIEKKAAFYAGKSIPTIWVLSAKQVELIQELEAYKFNHMEVQLLGDSGIDKYYEGDWYERIVKRRQKTSLPKDGGTRGSAYLLDVDTNTLQILRGLRPAGHLRVYSATKVLSEQISMAKLSRRGISLYFPEEEKWAALYQEAKDALALITAHELQEKQAREAEALERERQAAIQRKRAPTPDPSSTKSMPNDNREALRGLSPNEVKHYTCQSCAMVLPEREMSSYVRLTAIGTCKQCMMKM